MKKNFILLFVILGSCSHSKVLHTIQPNEISSDAQNTTPYKVYKIDSINNFYLIYARRSDSLYKIVSKKEGVENCNRIRENGMYDFKLHAHSENRTIGGAKILPQNSLLVNCFSYDDSTKICLERDSINDLHYAENIRGLCFIKK
jgi:hypothetical protein